jgi:CRP-like cAMP-binding protein
MILPRISSAAVGGMAGHDSILASLLRVPLFGGLRPLQITEIARQAERVRFRPGSVIAQAGQTADGAHLIVSGSAEKRADGSPDAAEQIEAGSLISELAMFIEYAPASTIVAVERIHGLRITRAALHEQMSADPALARHFEGIFIERLQKAIADAWEVDRLLEARAALVQAV